MQGAGGGLLTAPLGSLLLRGEEYAPVTRENRGVDMPGWKSFLAAAVVAMATIGGSALAHEGARTASSCSNLTLNAGTYGGKKTLRLVAIGVSCTKGRHLAEAFYRRAAGGGCGSHNQYCNLTLSGRWKCSFFFATESKETGGAISGCAHTGREKVRLYPTKGQHPSEAQCNRTVEYRPGLFAYIAEYVGMTCTEARNFAIARANHPSPPPSGFVCHDLHVEAGGGAEECVSGSRRIKIDNA